MSFQILDYAKSKILDGDFKMATAYHEKALSEGIKYCAVNLRYITKGYLVYPLEYENSSNYFELIKELRNVAEKDSDYMDEYKLALNSLYDIKRLFLRSLSLFYYSDILVSSSDSVVLKQIVEIQQYIEKNRIDILENDVYGLSTYVPKYNKKKFAKDLNIIEAYCMNILLSYTAEQHSVYQGKRYSALTVDYGYFYSTTVRETDRYYNYANVKPRMFLLGIEAYYFELEKKYEDKLKEIGRFDSPKELKKELTAYVEHKTKKDASEKEYYRYAKHFEKQDLSRDSWWGTMTKLSKYLNPIAYFTNPMRKLLKNNVGSFELNEYFPQKKFLGVCAMLAAGKGWKVDTVRALTAISCCVYVGIFVYLGLAIAKKFGFYFGVNVEKP